MNAGDWIQLAIAIVMLMAATAAVITAYMNYRSRPILIRTKEMHSEDLKRVLEWWRDGIASQGIPELHKPIDKATDFSLPAERSILFADLKRHIPRDSYLFNKWDDFKKQRRKVDNGRVTLYNSIKNYLKQYGRLEVLSTFTDSSIGISHHCPDWLFESVVVKAGGGGINISSQFQIETLPDGRVNLRRYGDYWARAESQFSAKALEELLTMTVVQIEGGEPGPAACDLLAEARSLVKEQAKLRDQCQALLNGIEAAKAIPILTGDCEHIARAREPFWPWQKR